MNIPSLLTVPYFLQKVLEKKVALIQQFCKGGNSLWIGAFSLFSTTFLLMGELIPKKGLLSTGYTVCSVLLTALYLRLAENCLQKNYSKKIDTLEDKLNLARSNKAFLRKQLLILRQKNHNYQASRKALKQLQEKINLQHKRQAKAIAVSLNMLKKSLLNPITNLSQQEQEILSKSYQDAEALSKGLWYENKSETIDLRDILNNISSLFAEEVHKSYITLEITFGPLPGIYSFEGDALLIELLLINLVGRTIYQAPLHSRISIMVNCKPKFLVLEVKSRGCKDIPIAEKLIPETFHFFKEDFILQDLCLEQNIQYYDSIKDGKNHTHIKIPLHPARDLPNNVIPLFS